MANRTPRLSVSGGVVTVTIAGPELARPKPQRKPAVDDRVSTAQWSALQGAFDHFNVELFGGILPPVVLNFSRHANSFGFFAPERWFDASGELVTHEISLNPVHLYSRDLRETYSTLVHEMAHLWQAEHGRKKSKRGYHNGEWADKMEAIGLQPVAADGDRVGYKVTHAVIDGGPYDLAFQRLDEEHKLPWLCDEPLKERVKRRRSKVKFTCPTCRMNVWAKPGAKPRCGEEGCDLESELDVELLDDEDPIEMPPPDEGEDGNQGE